MAAAWPLMPRFALGDPGIGESVRSATGGAGIVKPGRARLGGVAAILTVIAVLASGCAFIPPKWGSPPVPLSELGVDPATQTRCDPIAPECILPFPNDHFTVRDRSTPTGRRLALSSASLPTNASGAPIDVTDQNRADGWSPGSQVMVELPGLDVEASRIPGLADATRSLLRDSPIVLLDATTHRRLAFWAELDANADPGETPILFIRPVANFADGHRIVVGMRGLVDASHHRLEPTEAFAAYRDGQRTTDRTFESRRPEMERIFADLTFAGVARRPLQLAWDFTVASTESLTGRMLAIRDDAFRELGDATPAYTVTKVTENPNPQVLRRVEGTFELPLYLTDGGAPGGRFVLGPDGKPQRQPGAFTAEFVCNLPAAAAVTPARMALYGHGLFGERTEVNGRLTRTMAEQYDIAYCATDWYGMSENDLLSALTVLQDLSNMPKIADRIQQGFLAFLFLGRLMRDPRGFAADPAFRFDGRPALDTSQLYFDGNSQGAILGGALTAVAQDWTRSVIAEAGMNYSILLDRSVDFDVYLAVMTPSYPTRYDRIIGGAVIQLLWDRGETNGYANHVTRDPLPGTPRHEVLLLGAVGDHQVSEYSLRIEAATMGVRAHFPLAEPGRIADDLGAFLRPVPYYPWGRSAYFLWDTGSPSSPVTNTPPREGHDPHDDTPNIPEVRALKDQFWRPDGRITDVCAGHACTAPVPPENAD